MYSIRGRTTRCVRLTGMNCGITVKDLIISIIGTNQQLSHMIKHILYSGDELTYCLW